MQEEKLSANDEESGSEIYLDALDKDSSTDNIFRENELHGFESTQSIWNDFLLPLQAGVYHQIVEARVVLSSNCPKCNRNCKYPDRRGSNFKKLEETVLTYQITNKAEKRPCPICFKSVARCNCGKALVQSKPTTSQQKKPLCTAYAALPRNVFEFDCSRPMTKDANKDIISILGTISKIPVPQKDQTFNQFTSKALSKTCSKRPVQCGCGPMKNKFECNIAAMSKLSYFSSEELQLVHNITQSELTKTLKYKRCSKCDRALGRCICDISKSGRCGICGKPNTCCVCPKLGNNFKREHSKPFVGLQCICENKPATQDGRKLDSKPGRRKPKSSPSLNKAKKTKSDNKASSKDTQHETKTEGVDNKEGGDKKTKTSGPIKPPAADQKGKQTGTDQKEKVEKTDEGDGLKVDEGMKESGESGDNKKAVTQKKTDDNSDKMKTINSEEVDESNKGSEYKVDKTKCKWYKSDSVGGTSGKSEQDLNEGSRMAQILADRKRIKQMELEKKKETNEQSDEVRVEIVLPPGMKVKDAANMKVKVEKPIRKDVQDKISLPTFEENKGPVKMKQHIKGPDVCSENEETDYTKLGIREPAIPGRPKEKEPKDAKECEYLTLSDIQPEEEYKEDHFNEIQPGITITLELADKDENLLDGKNVEDLSLPEPAEKGGKICRCCVEETPLQDLRKCEPCKTKCKKCSKIPKSTSRISKGKKLCLCCASTNTEQQRVTEKGEQCEKVEGYFPMCTKCRQKIEASKVNTGGEDKKAPAVTEPNNQTNRSRCQVIGPLKRSSTFVCSRKSDVSKNACSKSCRRPSTASKIENRKIRGNDFNRRSPRESFMASQETVVQICQPCSEFLPMDAQSDCPRTNPLFEKLPKGKVCHCHATANTDRENMVDKGQQCIRTLSTPKKYKCKECSKSQTGGTLEQDMIASYVASCSPKSESPPPQEFIIQTLLYQFAGYELGRNPTPLRKKRPPDTSGNSQLTQSEDAMPSIQVQAGNSCPPKCQATQTTTTFVVTNTCAAKVNAVSAVEGDINFICGPNIPGLKTKVAMNVNQTPRNDDDCVCAPTSADETEKLLQPCNSSDCSYFQDHGIQENFTVVKKDKYVFITVTPVQTDPCEPDYYVILATPEDKTHKKAEIKYTKTPKKCKSPVQKTKCNALKKDPLDHFKNQIFSLETLKSKEFLELFDKKPDVIQNTGEEAPPCNAMNPICISRILGKTDREASKPPKLVENQQKNEDKYCGPDTCEYFESNNRKQQIECCFGTQVITTKTVACGSEHCLHQEKLDEFRSRKAQKSRIPTKQHPKKYKDIPCGPDTCSYIQQNNNDRNKDKFCISIQTEDTTKIMKPICQGEKPIVVIVTCDACTSTNAPEDVSSNPEYCDKQICTNECERGDAVNQTCINDDEENKISNKDTEVIYKYCDVSCEGIIKQMERATSPGEASRSSSFDSNEDSNDAEKQRVNAEPLKICNDKVCPEKSTQSTEKLPDEIDSVETFLKVDECRDSVCPKKMVNTSLDDQDVFKLEMAMNRFVQVNPKFLSDE